MTGARCPGRGSLSRRPPHCSAQRRARTHVSPGEAERPRASEARPHPAGTHPTSPRPLPRWDPRDARTDTRAARRSRAGRRTDMGRAAGLGHGMHLARRGRNARQAPFTRGHDPRLAGRRQQGRTARGGPAGTGAGRAPGVGQGLQVPRRAGVPGAGPDRRGRHDLAAGRPQAGPGRQVLDRRGRARRPWPSGGPARDVHDVRPRRTLRRIRDAGEPLDGRHRHDRLAGLQPEDREPGGGRARHPRDLRTEGGDRPALVRRGPPRLPAGEVLEARHEGHRRPAPAGRQGGPRRLRTAVQDLLVHRRPQPGLPRRRGRPHHGGTPRRRAARHRADHRGRPQDARRTTGRWWSPRCWR